MGVVGSRWGPHRIHIRGDSATRHRAMRGAHPDGCRHHQLTAADRLPSAARRGRSRIAWASARPFVGFFDDLDVAYRRALCHQQIERPHEQLGHQIVADVRVRDVDPEPLRLQAALVREGHGRVEHGSVLRHAVMLASAGGAKQMAIVRARNRRDACALPTGSRWPRRSARYPVSARTW